VYTIFFQSQRPAFQVPGASSLVTSFVRIFRFAVTLLCSRWSECEINVSKIKSPKEKKKLSLARDRRNTYGENPQASRKGIRHGKQRSHMEERRAVGRVLRHLKEVPDEDEAMEADVLAKTLTLQKKREAFKTRADEPLGVVIKRKLSRRGSA
jgi:hypothetical protein